jgi:type II secretory pathway component PulJ
MTLTEVVVAICLLVMVMGGAYSLIVRSSELSRSARRHYIAISLAKNRLERARNFLYNDLKLMAETDLTVNDNGNPNPNGRFRRTTTVNTNYAASLTEVIVVVKIRNPHTGLFTPDSEATRTLFTEYLAKP